MIDSLLEMVRYLGPLVRVDRDDTEFDVRRKPVYSKTFVLPLDLTDNRRPMRLVYQALCRAADVKNIFREILVVLGPCEFHVDEFHAGTGATGACPGCGSFKADRRVVEVSLQVAEVRCEALRYRVDTDLAQLIGGAEHCPFNNSSRMRDLNGRRCV